MKTMRVRLACILLGIAAGTFAQTKSKEDAMTLTLTSTAFNAGSGIPTNHK